MGKNDGFLLYERKNNGDIPPLKRTENFKEFHTYLDDEERRKQAARCMNCGVPMCQSAIKLAGMVTGCPLHNFIPEWNDALYKGQYDMAAWRLLKTSSFPEFTGRVCPALCEKACNCGNGGDIKEAVTIHDNELYIIEKAFESGYMKPQIPKVRSDKKIAVIGSGPAGLAVADLLNRRGHNVTVYEREDRIGGLLMYGIPNMKLEKSVIDRRASIMKKEGIEFCCSCNVGVDITAKEILDEFDAVVLACGAKEARGLGLGEENVKGVYKAVDFLTDTTKALIRNKYDMKAFMADRRKVTAHNKRVIIVGGGDTGNDCVGTCIREGCRSVTQLEMMPKPPEKRLPSNPWPEWPMVLKTDYGQQEAIAKFGHDPRIYQTTIKELNLDKRGNLHSVTTVQLDFSKKDPKTGRGIPTPVEGSEKTMLCDLLIIAAGFIGCQKYTAEAFGVDLTPRNVVKTNPGEYFTGKDKVFTAGDMHRGQSLVVWAISEGRSCAKAVDEYLMGYSFMS